MTQQNHSPFSLFSSPTFFPFALFSFYFHFPGNLLEPMFLLGYRLTYKSNPKLMYWGECLRISYHFKEFDVSSRISSKQGGWLATPANSWDKLLAIINILPRKWIHSAEFEWQDWHGESFMVDEDLLIRRYEQTDVIDGEGRNWLENVQI